MLHRQERKPTRKSLLRQAAALLLALVCLGGCNGGSETARNVIIISIDTLRADRLGCYGYDRPTSPALDLFAAAGTLFDNAVAQSPWTLPSHTTMLTGLYPHRNGVVDESKVLLPDVPTLASILSKEGFMTGAMMNSHWLSRKQGLSQGFLTFQGFPELGPVQGRAITDSAISWLDKYGDQQFFLFLHYYDVHSDYTPDSEFREMFIGPYDGYADGSTSQLQQIRDGELTYKPEDIKHVSDLYDAEIRQLDRQLGRLFDHVAKSGLDSNTLIVFTSDHGEEFLEHGGVLHGRTMYREILHVPLILRGPGIPQKKTITDLCMVADIVPTVLARLDIDVEHSFNGTDLFGEAERSGRYAYAEADWKNTEPDIKSMVRNSRFKLCFNRTTGEELLFDLESDPGEMNNIKEKHPGLVKELGDRLKRFRTSVREAGTVGPRSKEEIERMKSLGY